MRAGELRHKLTLQRSSKTRAVGGKRTTTWTDVAELYASIKPLSGDELQTAKATNAKASHEITTRYRAGITPKHRFTLGSRTFNIESVINVDERGATLKMVCGEDV